MQERNTYDLIRKKMLDAEMQAPGFDELFGPLATGEDTLRMICKEKLESAEMQAPPFDELFTEPLPLKKQAPVRKFQSWWTVAGVAAACMALILLLPKKSPTSTDTRSQVLETSSTTTAAHETNPKRLLTANITPEAQNSTDQTIETEYYTGATVIPVISSDQNQPQPPAPVEDQKGPLEKIHAKDQPSVTVHSERSLQDAYAEARLSNHKNKKDKPSVSLGISSANRLLSSVNEKSDNSSIIFSTSNGYNRMEGEVDQPMLRNYSTAENEWNAPENLNGLVLKDIDFKTYLPVNIGFTLSIPVFTDINLITGLQYTYLQNKISGKASGSDFSRKQELHYLGIPVKISYKLIHSGRVSLCILGGGTVEKGLLGVQNCHIDAPANGMNDWKNTQTITGIQTSLTGQLGLNFELSKHFILYTEPGVAWYPSAHQPISNRTEEPFNFNLSMGVRYSLR